MTEGALPSLCSIPSLGGPSWLEDVEEIGGVPSDGGILYFAPSRRRVRVLGLGVTVSFLDVSGGLLRTPAYCSTEPSPSLSSSSTLSMTSAVFPITFTSSSALPSRLNTPVGCLLTVVVSALDSAPSLSNTEVRFKTLAVTIKEDRMSITSISIAVA